MQATKVTYRSNTDLFHTPNETDRSTYVLRQHGAGYSWFGDIQYTCHLYALSFMALLEALQSNITREIFSYTLCHIPLSRAGLLDSR